MKAINSEDFVSLLLEFGDAFIIECVIPKHNNFWKDVFNSMLYVIKSYHDTCNYVEKKPLYLCLSGIIAILELI